MNPSLLFVRRAVLGAVGATSLLACNSELTIAGAGGAAMSTTKGSGSGTGVALGCDSPTPILNVDGSPTGFVRCADGSIDRPGGGACDTTIHEPACPGTDPNAACATDADCSASPHGRCASVNGGCTCIYSCATDADCAPSEVCMCSVLPDGGGFFFDPPPHSRCRPMSDCRVDADCASGECGLGSYPDQDACPQENWLSCRTGDDGCRRNAACPPPNSTQLAYCGGTPWQCGQIGCSVGGRPLVVDGVSHVARSRARSDWSSAATPDVTHRSATVRARAAAHYLALAKAEHASIASFARFALSLLAHGAPADLVRDANTAAIEEIAHARAAFALASAYAGEPLGPGGLAEAGAPMTESVEDLVRALVHEGCVGETVGVAEVLEVAASATDPVIAAHHRAIAADELRHAELAWRSLRWLVERDGALVSVAEHAFEEAIARTCSAQSAAPSAPEAGLLGGAERARAHGDVLRMVIEPARTALLRRFDA